MNRIILIICTYLVLACQGEQKLVTTQSDAIYHEKHRPQVHFSPTEGWMNDPNGMLYHNGEYHLFYQHYPDSNVWGPMHWGHAVSTDLVHWNHRPIALYPDSLGYIFSGSAVVDTENTSGLGSAVNPPLVAVFTYHSKEMEIAGRNDYQFQGLAYSADNGQSWIKYENNPVLKNSGQNDFRDPKIFWHDETKKWVMILAAGNHAEFWASPDLKAWSKLSDFGENLGAHGGVWECPDVFPLPTPSGKKWVMLVSINPGAPNGGSGTQYFTGDFDGKIFTPDTRLDSTVWLDYGPDNYAGVTWFNAPSKRKILLGWMSNWAYANHVPTERWRSANTMPRDLSLSRVNNDWFVKSELSPEVSAAASEPHAVSAESSVSLDSTGATIIKATFPASKFSFILSNHIGDKLVIGYDAETKTFYTDRGSCGDNKFSENFKGLIMAPRISTASKINLTAVVDDSSIEVFFDEGLSVITALYFPNKRLTTLDIGKAESVTIQKLNNIWTK
jgi:fructan beta-fructosidase